MDKHIRYLPPKRVAEYLGVGRSKVYEMIRSGELPSRRFGRRIGVPIRALEWQPIGDEEKGDEPVTEMVTAAR